MANDIVWAHSGEANAPVLNNATGSLDALLNALLVTGWGLQTVTSVVVAGNVATVTKAGHGFADGRMVDHSGATPSGLNGRKRITLVDANTYTFPAPGIADGTATGTITAKRSSLGWSRPHSSGNVSIYARTDVTATTMALRINDSAAAGATTTFARTLGVWGYTDVNTWTEQFPTNVQESGGLWWPKGANSGTAKPWVLVGDSKCFYLFTDSDAYPSTSYGGVVMAPVFFGDLVSYRPSDAYGCVVAGGTSSNGPIFELCRMSAMNSTNFNGMYAARPSYGLGQPVRVQVVGPSASAQYIGSSGPLFPSPNGDMVIQAPALTQENIPSFGYPIRGHWPGLGLPLANLGAGTLHLQVLPNLSGSGRDWLLVGYQAQGTYGHMAFDLTGPWA